MASGVAINGAFGAGRKATELAEVTDGLAATIAISEHPIGDDTTMRWRNPVVVAEGEILQDENMEPEFWRDVAKNISSDSQGYDQNLATDWRKGAHLFYNHLFPPNTSVLDVSFGRHMNPRCGAISARSFHDDGVHALRLDGSGHFTAALANHPYGKHWRPFAAVIRLT